MNDLLDAATRLGGSPPPLAEVEVRAVRRRRRAARRRVGLAAVVLLGLAGGASLANRVGDGERVTTDEPAAGRDRRPTDAVQDLVRWVVAPTDERFAAIGLADRVRFVDEHRVLRTASREELRDPVAWGETVPLLAEWFNGTDGVRMTSKPSIRCGAAPIPDLVLDAPNRLVVEDGTEVRCRDYAAVTVYLDGGEIIGIGLQRTPTGQAQGDGTARALAVARFARGEGSVEAIGFADDVALLLGSRTVKTVPGADLADIAQWVIDLPRGYAGRTGTATSAIPMLSPYADDELTIAPGPGGGCPRFDPEAPQDLEYDDQVHIEPADVGSCLAWTVVDVYLRDGDVVGIGVDLYEP